MNTNQKSNYRVTYHNDGLGNWWSAEVKVRFLCFSYWKRLNFHLGYYWYSSKEAAVEACKQAMEDKLGEPQYL